MALCRCVAACCSVLQRVAVIVEADDGIVQVSCSV